MVVPKLHKKGHSFKGAAMYLLHDKDGADTAERVAWVSTRNLAVEDPDVAWRIMAAVAMNQDELKRKAGIKNTGRKSTAHVQHLSLSWHEEEAPGLDRQAMLGAAEAAIAVLGASDHQAMIVCHDDEPQPHVHILLNRVSPIDGRILSSSKEKLKLSQWAEQYEKDRGKIYCDQRVINNDARRRGEYVRGEADVPRHIYEMQQKVANENFPKEIIDMQKKIARSMGDMDRRHAKQWEQLDDQHRERVAAIRQETRQSIRSAITDIQEQFRPRWVVLHHQHQADKNAFDLREEKFIGRMQNRFKSINLKRVIHSDQKKQTLGEVFGVFTSKASRLEALKQAQALEVKQLEREQNHAKRDTRKTLRTEEKDRLMDNRRLFITERSNTVLTQKMERAKLKAEWKQQRQRTKEAVHARNANSQENLPSAVDEHVMDENDNPYLKRMRQRLQNREQERERGDREGGREL